MASLARTVAIPLRPSAASLTWESKGPADVLDYSLDATAFLADAAGQLSMMHYDVDPSLNVVSYAWIVDALGKRTGGTITVAGGTPGTSAEISFTLAFADGRRKTTLILLPITADPFWSPPVSRAVTFLNRPVLMMGRPVILTTRSSP